MWSHFISCLKKFIEISFITPTENGPSDEKRTKLSNPQVALSTLISAYSKNKKFKWKNMNGQFRILFELNGWMRWWEFGLCYPLILKSHRQVHTQPKNEFFIEIYPLDVVLLNFYHPSVLRNSMQKNGHQNTTDEWVNKIKVQYHISHRATKYAKHFFRTNIRLGVFVLKKLWKWFVRHVKPIPALSLCCGTGLSLNDCHLFVISCNILFLSAGHCKNVNCTLKRKTSHFISLKCKLKSLCFSSLSSLSAFFSTPLIDDATVPHTNTLASYTHYCYQNVFALKMLCIQK